MKPLLAVALFLPTCLHTNITSAAEEGTWPNELFGRLSAEVSEMPNGKAVWHGGIGTDDNVGNPVGLVVWSASGGSNSQIELVVSCFLEDNYHLPQIVAYMPDVDQSEQLVDVRYQYDSKAEQAAQWLLIDKRYGGLFAHTDGDFHVREMMAGNKFSLNALRADRSVAEYTYSLSGFTREFAENCSWHPNYANWVAKPVASQSRDYGSEIQEFAKREFPDDKRMQNFVYKKQTAALRYLGTVPDSDMLKFAQREYPEDYAMQKFTYDKQTAAKRYIQSVDDEELKAFSAREYPQDFAMQKFTYDKQFAAKGYMASADNKAVKAKAERKWPRDYAMQKFTYDKEAF